MEWSKGELRGTEASEATGGSFPWGARAFTSYPSQLSLKLNKLEFVWIYRRVEGGPQAAVAATCEQTQ